MLVVVLLIEWAPREHESGHLHVPNQFPCTLKRDAGNMLDDMTKSICFEIQHDILHEKCMMDYSNHMNHVNGIDLYILTVSWCLLS